MIAGLPLGAWLLIILAIFPALALIVAFYLTHRRQPRPPGASPIRGKKGRTLEDV